MSEETIDRDLGKALGRIAEFRAWAEGKVREVEIILMGPTGDNGIRGNVRELKADHEDTKKRLDRVDEDLREAKAWGRRVWEVERHEPGKCIGSVRVEELRADLKAKDEREDARMAEHRRLTYMMMGSIIVSLLTVAGNIAVAFITAAAKSGGGK